MDYIFVVSSIIAAFIAGIAALFAPCCITVLLPAYLASIFRQKRTIIAMTFVFFLGLLTVFLPLGIGMASLGILLRKNHDAIFIIGGLFMLLLGAYTLLGLHFSLPFKHPKVKIETAGPVFILGIFSAFATLCCAPVLAGVLALSILPGSILWGSLYALAYVLGMVTPLFILAYFIDRKDLTKKLEIFNKNVSYSLAGRKIEITVADAIAGIAFAFMGLLILYLAKTGKLAMGGSSYQTSINIYLSNLTSYIDKFLAGIPPIAWILLPIIMIILVIVKIKNRTKV